MNKLPSWKVIPRIDQLKADLDAARPLHQLHCANIKDWLDKLDGKLDAKIANQAGRSKVQPKLIRKHAEWRYASLEEPFLSTKNLFDIEPVGPEDVANAQETEMLLNNQFSTKIDKTRFINEYVRTATDEGTVIVQVGWKYTKEVKKVNVRVNLTPEQVQMKLLTEVRAGKITEQEAVIRAQNPNEAVQWIKREQEFIKHNHPTVRICEYDRVIIDPSCEGDIKKAQFVIIPTETNIAELLKDPSYDLSGLYSDGTTDIDSSKLTDASFSEYMTTRGNGTNNFQFKDTARKRLVKFEYYGYWDIDGNNTTRAIKAEWIGDTLIKLEESPYPDNELPFVLVQFMPERKSIYGTPDGKLIEDNQDIMGALMRGIIDVMGRSANGQQLISKGFLDPLNQIKFDKGENAYYNEGKDPRANIHMQTYPEIPASALNMLELLSRDAESLTGVIAFNSGISGQALGSTATSVRGALDSASKRELGILRRLSKGIEDIGRKIIAMNSEFVSDEEVIRLTNKEFRTINKDNLTGSFDLSVNISTAESDAQKVEKLAFMLQTLGQNMGIDLVKLILGDIAELQKMPELAQKIREFQQEPDPLETKTQEMTIEKMNADIEKVYADIEDKKARAQENLVDVRVKEAKIEDMKATTRQKHSSTDMIDLNYLEKEAGLDKEHEYNMKKVDSDNKLQEQALVQQLRNKSK